MKLKADLHTHSSEDAKDVILYDAYQLIDRAAGLGFDVLAVTNHNTVTYNQDLAHHAQKRNILMIPGIEATLSRKHVIILNPDFDDSRLPAQLEDLSRIKHENSLIMAPHPYFPQSCALKNKFWEYASYFDAMEYSHFYHSAWNYNHKAEAAAEITGLPLIGSSDCHFLWEMGTTYSWVDADKNIPSVIQALKAGKVTLVTSPLSSADMGRSLLHILKMRALMGLRELKRKFSG